jgi:hypothetical protein
MQYRASPSKPNAMMVFAKKTREFESMPRPLPSGAEFPWKLQFWIVGDGSPQNAWQASPPPQFAASFPKITHPTIEGEDGARHAIPPPTFAARFSKITQF